MKNEKIIIGLTVGYMLKVMKAQKDLSKFRNEFACIRHGNYHEFIKLLKAPVPEMVVYIKGVIETNPESKEDDFDFLGLFKSGPSLKVFYQNCANEFGVFTDHDISNEIFYEAALFEISLRMHANNNNLITKNETLQNVIIKLCNYKNIDTIDIDKFQKGRNFLNMIKHLNDKYSTWSEGIIAFKAAYELLDKYKLTIL